MPVVLCFMLASDIIVTQVENLFIHPSNQRMFTVDLCYDEVKKNCSTFLWLASRTRLAELHRIVL
jgi:hypothetical protein